MIQVICDYCGKNAERQTGSQIYPHRWDLRHLHFWACKPCDASVQCIEISWRPRGRLANAALRELRIKAHKSFDRLWKDGHMSRNQAYKWLAERHETSRRKAHIGLFDNAQCEQTIEFVDEWFKDNLQANDERDRGRGTIRPNYQRRKVLICLH